MNEAIGRLESSLETNPDNIGTYLSLGNLHTVAKDYGRAKEIYEKALSVDPDAWAVNNNLAFLLSETSEETRDLKRAATLAQKAMELRPDDPTVMDTLGWIHYRQKDYPAALDLLEKAAANNEDNQILNYHLGMVLFRLDRLVEAREKLEKAIAAAKTSWGLKRRKKPLRPLRPNPEFVCSNPVFAKKI